VRIEFTTTLQDFVAAQRLHCFRKYGSGSGRLPRILYPILGALTLVYSFHLFHQGGVTSLALLELFCGLYLLLAGNVIAPYLYRRRYLRTRGSEGGINLDITEESIQLDCPGRSSGRLEWNAILGVLDGPSVTLLYLSPATFLMVPRRVLSGAMHQDLLAICKSRGLPFTYPKLKQEKSK
jgi:YcxB-like protein